MSNDTEKLIPGSYRCIFKKLMLEPECGDYLKDLIHMTTRISYKDLKDLRLVDSNDKRNVELFFPFEEKIKAIVSIVGLDLQVYKDEGCDLDNDNDCPLNGHLNNELSDTHLKCFYSISMLFDNVNRNKSKENLSEGMLRERTTNIALDEFKLYNLNLEYIYNNCHGKKLEELSKFERYCLMLMADTEEFANYIAGEDATLIKVKNILKKLSQDKDLIEEAKKEKLAIEEYKKSQKEK